MSATLLRISCMFIATTLLLNGCGRANELNELSIVTGSGIDGKEGNYTVTYQVSVASANASAAGGASGGSSQSGVHVFSTTGKTIRDTIFMSAVEHPRRLYFAHNNVLIISKETAESGISTVLDSYFRNPESREMVDVMVTDGKARDILTKNIPPEKLPGRAIAEIVDKEQILVSFYPATSVFQLALGITSESQVASVPEIGISGENPKSLETADAMTKTSQDAKVRMTGLVIFKGDRVVGKMNLKESLGLAWLTNRVKGTMLSFPNPDSSEEPNQSAVRVFKAKVKITPVKESTHYTIKLKAEVRGELAETTTQEDLTDTAGIHKLERSIEKIILEQMQVGWEAAKAMKVDILGIGNRIHERNPKEWNRLKSDWDQELAQMELQAEVKMKVVRTRMFLDSFKHLLKQTEQ
ncbi:Ger(x)C family spore germination protein [Paenibacillus sp. NFR01]|uniref:Ger(x)C family spore germination protein n=1 Tax=Paenibacillus sp. NFR01 TaxID=1566279 RepID=UPI0008AB2AF9|nr:Ger(x)C family spore germination protein [Paenibacillus sp. NFR01]SET61478.1 spore germination protein KC [Paenibacillus sp. NFR01]